MQRSDEAIRRDVMRRVRSNPRLRNDDLSVAVEDRMVTVAGTVDTIREQREVMAAARRVRGVRDVSLDLSVTSVENAPVDLAEQVQARLESAGITDIEVNAAEGRVNLVGDIADPTQRQRAVRLTEDVPGVLDVMDNLDSNIPEDDEVGSRRRGLAGQDPYVDGIGAFDQLTREMSTPGRLSGAVGGNNFGAPAASRDDIRDVLNTDVPGGVDVKEDPRQNDPKASPSALDAPAARTSTADGASAASTALIGDVETELADNPRLRDYDITVQASGPGRVILSGSVTSWVEWAMARRAAFEAGADDVEMTITVQ